MAGDLRFDLLLAVVDKATAPLRAIGQAFQGAAKAGESLGKLGQYLHDARENIQDFADRGTAALQGLVAPAAEVENALLQLKPVAELAGSNAAGMLARVRTESEAYSQAHSTQAAAYVEAATAMMRVTQDEGKALQGTNVAMQLATATTTDAKGAVSGLYALYGVAGDKTADWGSELTRLSDVLTRARQIYGDAINVAEISDPLKDASAAARDAKVPVEQLVGALGAFGVAGIKGGEGGAAVANVITGLQAAAQPLGVELAKTASGGLDLVKSLQAITAKYGDLRSASPEALAAMQQAFGPAWRDVSMLLGQTDQLSKQWGQIGSSAGAAASGQAAAEATMSGQLAKLNNQLDSVKVTLGTSIMSAVSALAPTLIEIVKPMAEFVSAHPQLSAIAGTVAVLTVGAASLIAPIVSLASAVVGFGGAALTASGGIGAAATASWAWAAALMANPITWIVLAVIAAVALIYIYWEPISKFFMKLWGQIKETFSGTWDTLVAVWGAVVGFFTGIWKEVKDAFDKGFIQGIWKVITLLSPLAWMVRLWGAIVPWLAGLWSKAGTAVLNGLAKLGGIIVGFFAGIWADIKAEFTRSFIGGVWKVFTMVSPLGWIIKLWSVVVPWLAGLWMKVGAAVLNGLAKVGGVIIGLFSGIWQSIKDAFGQGILQGLAKLFELFNPVSYLMKWWNIVTQFLFGLSLTEVASRIGNSLLNGLASVGGAIVGVFNGIWQSIKDAFGQGILQGLAKLFELFNPVSWLMQWWNTVTQYLFGLSLTEVGSRILTSLLNGMVAVGGAISGFIASLGSAIWSGISSDLQRVWDAISGFSLAEAGANIVNTIVEGIKSAASGPAEAMADVVAAVRAYLPFSPAKVGPLRDLHRVKLVETVASAVHPEPLVSAMSGVAGAAFDAISSLPAPELRAASAAAVANDVAGAPAMRPMAIPPVAGMPQSYVDRSSSTTSNAASMPVTFQIMGGGDPQSVIDELERWMRDPSNAKKLAAAVKRHDQREKRKAFG